MRLPMVESQRDRERWWPVATVSVLAVTAVLTVLQFPFPQVRLALWRDPAALAAGQWWRLVTPLFVQYDAVWQIALVFAFIAGIGALAERVFGPARWLLLYLGCGVVGQAFGYRWDPPDAGAWWPAPGWSGRCARGCCRRPGRARPASASGGPSGWWPGSRSPPRATCTDRRCWSASASPRCCCGATGAAIRPP